MDDIAIEPIVKGGRPARLPHRGPLQRPAEIRTPAQFSKLINESDLTLFILRDPEFPLNASPSVDSISNVLPLIRRLHRNLLYLSIASEVGPELLRAEV